MIDLQEPQRPSYSEEEKQELSHRFILLLHTLLLVYLSVHNLFIPLSANLLKGLNPLIDVHFWFLFQLPIQWWLRREGKVPGPYLAFLITGSAVRLGYEFMSVPSFRSWGIMSVLISELSAFIFYFVYLPKVEWKGPLYLALLGAMVAPTLSHLEVKGQGFGLPVQLTMTKERMLEGNLGCHGHEGSLRFPLERELPTRELSVVDCGLSQKVVWSTDRLVLQNRLKVPVNLRLYKLKVLHGKVRWSFLRLIRVEAQGTWIVSDHFKDAPLYLIKSPERRKLGHTVIVPPGTTHFPLGRGELNFNYDSLRWVSL